MELSTMRILPVPQNGTMFDHMDIKDFKIPNGYILVKNEIFCGQDMGITIYTPDAPLLAESNDNTTKLEKIDYDVLISCSYKSSYMGKDARYQELKRYFKYTLVEVNASREKLKTMGLMNKNGAINDRGRNELEKYQGPKYF